MTGITASRGQTGLSGRHVDISGVAGRLTRRLNPTAFTQSMLIVCLALVIWPATFGGRFGVAMVAGNSMEPTYMLGDAVITWLEPVDIGDTILFRVPEGEHGAGNPVIHRVVGGDGAGWMTHGALLGISDGLKLTSSFPAHLLMLNEKETKFTASKRREYARMTASQAE